MNFEEFKALAKGCKVKGMRPSDAEVDFIQRKMTQSEARARAAEITEESWLHWVRTMEGRRDRALIYLQQARDLRSMPSDTAQQVRERAYAEGALQ